jgi:RNA polymerase sigma factor (sigma-70 family)
MNDELDLNSLIARARAGSEAAARELHRLCGTHIVRAVRRKLVARMRTKFDSEDFAQAVWASFFAMPAERVAFEQPADLLAFLGKIAQNKVADEIRHRVQTRKRDLDRERSLHGSAALEAQAVHDPQPRPSEVLLAEEEWQRLIAAVPAHQRVLLEQLRLGKTQAQIAAEYGVDERTIRRLIQRLHIKRSEK